MDALQTKDFTAQCNKKNKNITFCVVGGHYQNGIVERKINELTLIFRTLLLHAIHHYPNYTIMMMWPFSLKEAAFCLNKVSIRSYERSNEATFFGVNGDIIKPTMFHNFVFPCFVLYARL